jgi:hypothetical protein
MKIIVQFLLLIFPLCIRLEICAQESPQVIQFHRTHKAFGQYSNRVGIGSELPASYFRNDLQMTLTVYDVPVSASCLITTEQLSFKQDINNFRIYLDITALKKKGMENAGSVGNSEAVTKLMKTKDESHKNWMFVKLKPRL